MRTSTKLYILVFAIIFAVILPPILCYIFIVRPADHTAGQDTSTNTGNEHTSTEGLDTTDAAKSFTILIDPGHGGFDPGKVSPDGIMEKDINLAIASKLASALTDQGFSVYLTRDSDKSLNSENASSKKTSDLKARTNLATNVNADLYISIHQNSYHEEAINGGQVFYYKTSEKGKRLADILQKRFDFVLGENNRRQAKPNDTYYLLLHVKSPIVIVECGFLSNWDEAARLNSTDYQDRLAWTLHMGILRYLNTRNCSVPSQLRAKIH